MGMLVNCADCGSQVFLMFKVPFDREAKSKGKFYCFTCFKYVNLMKPELLWEKVGEIDVDAGLCWIGDPCYILHREGKDQPKSVGTNWGEFCDKLDEDVTQFAHNGNYPGLGIAVSTGYGDGSYGVFVQKDKHGRIMSVKVDFSEGVLEDDEYQGH